MLAYLNQLPAFSFKVSEQQIITQCNSDYICCPVSITGSNASCLISVTGSGKLWACQADLGARYGYEVYNLEGDHRACAGQLGIRLASTGS